MLLYAYDADSERHKPARAFLEAALSGSEVVGIPWVVVLAFLRISTNPRVFERPLGFADALAIVSSLLDRSIVHTISAGHDHWAILSPLLRESQANSSMVADAHIAALALENGATLVSNDRDFLRFKEIKLRDPFGR